MNKKGTVMLFQDRQDAGQKLAEALKEYFNNLDTVIIALPRGGVVIGYEMAKILHLPLDIMSPRKIGAPFNPEYAIGAITETGEGIFSKDVIASLGISEEVLQEAVEKEKKIAKERLLACRGKRPARDLKGKRVIIVDDGLATGSTMRAAIKTAKKEEAKEIIVAVPVAPPDTLKRISKEVDRAFALHTPSSFYAVGQFYERFEQTSDQEVISLLQQLQMAIKP